VTSRVSRAASTSAGRARRSSRRRCALPTHLGLPLNRELEAAYWVVTHRQPATLVLFDHGSGLGSTFTLTGFMFHGPCARQSLRWPHPQASRRAARRGGHGSRPCPLNPKSTPPNIRSSSASIARPCDCSPIKPRPRPSATSLFSMAGKRTCGKLPVRWAHTRSGSRLGIAALAHALRISTLVTGRRRCAAMCNNWNNWGELIRAAGSCSSCRAEQPAGSDSPTLFPHVVVTSPALGGDRRLATEERFSSVRPHVFLDRNETVARCKFLESLAAVLIEPSL
jgi:hypothetical protein